MEKKILIIEDDRDTVEAMRMTLENEGHRIISANDLDEGVKKAHSERPDLIILDVMFGKRETAQGFDFAVKIRQDEDLALIPILMVSAVNIRHPQFHFSPESDGEFLPVDDFIDKPAQPKVLTAKVKNLLAQKHSKWKDWPQKSD